MLRQLLVGGSVLAAALGGAPAANTQTANTPVKASLVKFDRPTRVAGYFLIGRYIVVHDERKMARGEPCTTFYGFDGSVPATEVVAFHCIPRGRPIVAPKRRLRRTATNGEATTSSPSTNSAATPRRTASLRTERPGGFGPGGAYTCRRK